jgi:predicted acylesterase/phospholipase RssA
MVNSISASAVNFFVGTSIGALVGGLYAREGDLITTSARAKQFSGRMGNIWRLLSDVTYPIVAYTTVSRKTVYYVGSPKYYFFRAMSSIGQSGR